MIPGRGSSAFGDYDLPGEREARERIDARRAPARSRT